MVQSGVLLHFNTIQVVRKGTADMFFGQHYHNVDKKGRVFVPAKYRDELGDEFKFWDE